jgi:uncharacterized protein (DUF885 family)
MKKILLFVAVVVLTACDQTNNKEIKHPVAVQNFQKFASDFVESLWKLNPIQASYEGYHVYDYMLPIPNEARRQEELTFAKAWLSKLHEFDYEALDADAKIDYSILEDYLNSFDFYIKEFKSSSWDPSNYNLGGAFFQVINYRDHSLDKRLEDISKKLDHVESYYSAAKSNLDRPTKVHTELAIQQLNGSKSIFEKTLVDSLNASNQDVVFKEDFIQKLNDAVAAIDQFKTHLEEEVLPTLDENGKSFRIGKELFEKKFYYQIQSAYSAEEVFAKAVEEKEVLHENLLRLSDLLWEKYFGAEEKPGNRLGQIKRIIDAVAKTHVHRDSFVTAIRQQIPELEDFVREKDLLTLDPNKPLVVRETPEYMRGFAGASISAPGPYDRNAETYYNVTPLDDYTDEEAESYLREYNHYTLQILNIHEAIPGHYAQLVYSNQSPSLVKSLFGNGAMVEGWAVYTEKMMLENDYGGNQLEIGLMYYKWNLRTVCNTILDYGIHVLDFSEEEAMQLLMKEAFQEKSEAEGKWRRARLSQVQLCSYFTGYYEIMQLRQEIKDIQGEEFDLKKFHEEFLSYGSSPVKYIRDLMLKKLEVNKEPS